MKKSIKSVAVNKQVHIVLVIVWLSFFTNTIRAQQQHIDSDSSTITPFPFAKNLAQKYQGKDFEYDHSQEEGSNILARAIHWVLEALSDTFGIQISPQATEITKTIVYLLCILLALYVCVKIFMRHEISSFFVKPTAQIIPFTIHDEEIETIDFDDVIKKALAQREYRVAIRYLYLKALRELSFHRRIEYHPEKTNTAYIQEIEDAQLQQDFTQVSYIYEHTWYGEFPVNEAHYSQLRTSFDHLFNTLHRNG